MTSSFLNTANLPYCKGCGHDLIAKNTAKALDKLGYKPLDVIMVTDIGCHGIIDKCLNTHTVHGLHGRSTALGVGISIGLSDPDKKVIVFIGDGGATIGLQHILEAARLNLNMAVILHNNLLYGMTGGQTSGLTPHGFKTTTSFEGNPLDGYDICALTHAAGGNYVCRITGIGDISDKLAVAIGTRGFSLAEVIEICPSYGIKLNPGRKLQEVIASSGKKQGEWMNSRERFMLADTAKTTNLLDKAKPIPKDFKHYLKRPMRIIMSGSAGEGVQLAAAILCKAAIRSGMTVSQKGSYPVTVGVGFSTSEINLAPENIFYHGIDIPDACIITSNDGLAHNRKRIATMKDGLLIIDSSLNVPETGAKVIKKDFRSVGARNAAFFAVLVFAIQTGILSTESLFKTIELDGLSDKLPIAKIKEALVS